MNNLAYEKGKKGEDKAKEFLLYKKYIIIDTNYRTNLGEIDIIAKDNNNFIRFIEVKNKVYSSIEDIITVFINRNLKNYYKIINYYVYKNKIETAYYIDLIILDQNKVFFYKNVSQELYSF